MCIICWSQLFQCKFHDGLEVIKLISKIYYMFKLSLSLMSHKHICANFQVSSPSLSTGVQNDEIISTRRCIGWRCLLILVQFCNKRLAGVIMCSSFHQGQEHVLINITKVGGTYMNYGITSTNHPYSLKHCL